MVDWLHNKGTHPHVFKNASNRVNPKLWITETLITTLRGWSRRTHLNRTLTTEGDEIIAALPAPFPPLFARKFETGATDDLRLLQDMLVGKVLQPAEMSESV